MPNIKSYNKEGEKREQKQSDYKNKIIKHKLTNAYRIILILIALGALIALILNQYNGHIYTDYDLVSTLPREQAAGAKDIRLDKMILTYSRDGAHCTDAKGTVIWNETYGIQDVKVATNRNTVAIAEYNGNKIYVQNTENRSHEITTEMPIRDVAVSATGMVTAVLDGTDYAIINTYSIDGKLAYQGQAHMNDSGYPAALNLSPDGELLCISYWYLDAGVIKSNIAFYNLGPVGQNNSDFVVSVQSYTDTVVPQVGFLDDSTAFAVGDNSLMIYAGQHKPTEKARYFFDEEVQAVYYNEKYLGLVFPGKEGEGLYRLDVFNTKAEKIGSFSINMDFRDIIFDKDLIIVYSGSECTITTMKGVQKYSGTLGGKVQMMLPTGKAYRYVVVTEDSLDTIQLK